MCVFQVLNQIDPKLVAHNREKCLDTDLFLVYISWILTELEDSRPNVRKAPYSIQIRENTDKKGNQTNKRTKKKNKRKNK